MKIKHYIPVGLGVLILIFSIFGCRRNSSVEADNSSISLGVVNIKIDINKNYDVPYDRVFLFDETYQVPSKKWVEDSIISTFPEHLRYVEITKHISEISDCDKYSRAFVEHANKILRRTKSSTNPISIGIMSYVANFSGKLTAHQINIILTDSGIFFFEPQHNKFVTLSPEEIKSITRIFM